MKNMKALKHEAGIKSFPVHDFMNFMVSMVDIFFPAEIFLGKSRERIGRLLRLF